MTIGTPTRPAVGYDFERKPFYTPSEIAQILKISDETVRERIHSGRLFAVQLGPRLYRVPLSAFMRFLGEPPRVQWVRTQDPSLNAEAHSSEDEDEHA